MSRAIAARTVHATTRERILDEAERLIAVKGVNLAGGRQPRTAPTNKRLKLHCEKNLIRNLQTLTEATS
jgi:hypothetical protein